MGSVVLAFDIGASSGRGMLGSIIDGKMVINEIYRFKNEPVSINGTLYWDILRIFQEIKNGISAAVRSSPNGIIDSIGIDTWGVDFGFISKNGKLLDIPVHYRDNRCKNSLDTIRKNISQEELYSITGTQFMTTNTLYQIVGLQNQKSDLLERAGYLLMIPDLLINFLTGDIACDRTIASTTQLYDPGIGDWSDEVLDIFKIPRRIMPPIVEPGSFRGVLKKEICDELSIPTIPVYTVTGHDTAAAVLATPFNENENDELCISCGTVSVIGIESSKKFVNEKAFLYNFTNEIGYNNIIRLMKNVQGMWMINECRRRFERIGRKYNYDDVKSIAEKEEPFACIIDPDNERFLLPDSLPNEISDFCRCTNQKPPKNDGQLFRCIYESIALKHAFRINQLSEITGIKYRTIFMVGGGSNAPLLCQMISSASGCDVFAGPSEAAVMGNCAAQFIAIGEISDINDARKIIGKSFEGAHYSPTDSAMWKQAMEKFMKII